MKILSKSTDYQWRQSQFKIPKNLCEKYEPNENNVFNKISFSFDFTIVSENLIHIGSLVTEIQHFEENTIYPILCINLFKKLQPMQKKVHQRNSFIFGSDDQILSYLINWVKLKMFDIFRYIFSKNYGQYITKFINGTVLFLKQPTKFCLIRSIDKKFKIIDIFSPFVWRHHASWVDFHVGPNFFLINIPEQTSLPNFMLLTAMHMLSLFSIKIPLPISPSATFHHSGEMKFSKEQSRFCRLKLLNNRSGV